MKKKFVLEFDEEPALVFVSREGKGYTDELYINGELAQGVRDLQINSEVEGATEYEANYYVFQQKKESNYENI